jgi:hypothetical protein
MKRFLKERGWYISMVAGIGLLASMIILDREFFTGQTILAAVLIIFSLVIETSTKKI